MALLKAGVLVLAVVAAALGVALVSADVIGIDLGSQLMKVALVKPGNPFQIVHDTSSKRKTPSAVAFDGDERLYGWDTGVVSVRKPEYVFSGIARALGHGKEHPIIAGRIANDFLPFVMTEDAERGTLNFRAVPAKDGAAEDDKTFSAEELVAQVLEYAKYISEATSNTKIRDAVITVPAFYTPAERQATIDAATLAGLNVLALVEENTAAVIQFGIDRVIENSTVYTLVYNMGATSTQVSLVASNSYPGKEMGQNRTIGQASIVAKAWDTTLGGIAFDQRIMNFIADEFNKKHSKAGDDVRKVPRAMAKIRKTAERVKEILSANSEFPITIEGLHDGVDFRSSMTRVQFEALCADLFDRVLAPVHAVLADAGMTPQSVQEVEIIGGGVRVPKIQTILKDFFGGRALGVHLNGDEAMALGASFLAANRSTAFRVRKVGIIDTTPFAIGLRLYGPATAASEVSADSTPEVWTKRSQLFKRLSPLSSVRRITFPRDADFLVDAHFESETPIPAGTDALIATYNISGVAEFAQKWATVGSPKVALSFKLDHNGLLELTKAEALVEEVETAAPAGDGAAAAKADDKADDADDATDADAAGGATPAAAEGTEKKPETAPAATPAEGDAAAAPASTPKPKKKIHRGALTFTRVSEGRVKPLTPESQAASVKKLAGLRRKDEQRRAKAQARSDLESLVYATRDRMEEGGERLQAVTTEEQREEVSNALSSASEWLYDEGEDATIEEYRARKQTIDDLVTPFWTRVAEDKCRPEAVSKALKSLRHVNTSLEDWVKSKPQINETERAMLSSKAAVFEGWLKEVLAAQSKTPKHEAPVFTCKEVNAKAAAIRNLVKVLSKKPKPKPPAKPANETATNSTSTDGATNSTVPPEEVFRATTEDAPETPTTPDAEAEAEAEADGEGAAETADGDSGEL